MIPHRRDFLYGLGTTLGTVAFNALLQAESKDPLASRPPHLPCSVAIPRSRKSVQPSARDPSSGDAFTKMAGTVKKAMMNAAKMPNGTASPGVARARQSTLMKPMNRVAVIR